MAAIVPVFFNDDFAVLLFFGDIGSFGRACKCVSVNEERERERKVYVYIYIRRLCLPRTQRNEERRRRRKKKLVVVKYQLIKIDS